MYQLGQIRFEGLKGFDSFSTTQEAVYAELALIGGKPRLQRIGTSLKEITAAISLHAAFTDPAADIAALNDHREAGDVLTLINGDGDVIGDFIIASIEESVTQTSPTGRTLSAQISLKLREYFDPNKAATEAKSAQNAAFAVGTDKVVPVRLVRPPITEMTVTSQRTAAGDAASRDGIATLRNAPVNTPQQASLLVRAKKVLESGEQAYKDAKAAVSGAANIAAKAPQLSGQLDNVLALIADLIAQISAGNIANALSAADALEAALPGLASAIRPINALLMTRQPQ